MKKQMQDLKRKSRIYRVLSLIFCLLDCITNFTIELTDIIFTQRIENDDAFDNKLTRISIEVILVTGFIIFVIVNIIKRNRFILAFISYVYLIFGLVLFSYLLIQELKEVNGGEDSSFSRPLIFYDLHLDLVLLVLILSGIIFRVSSIVFIFFLSSKLNALEILIKCNLCENIFDSKNHNDTSNVVDEKSEVEQAEKKKKEDGKYFINHSCESTDKESESLNKEKENMPVLESPVNQYNNIVININHERKPSLIDYFKKIVK